MKIDINMQDWQHLQQMAAIGELTTGIVHDLKNQLACIGVNLSLIEALNQAPNLEKYTANVKRQLEYSNEMIDLMLKMGRRDVRHTDFDLALLIEDVAVFFERVAGRGITVKTYVDGSAHLISGCQSLISNSILNLCANAKDAVGDAGVIEVSLHRDDVLSIDNDVLGKNVKGPCSVLTVKDTGCGIAREELSKIFEPFFSTKTESKLNAGMGLANVIHTAKVHGASMTVDSVVGVGTTFKLYFKAAA